MYKKISLLVLVLGFFMILQYLFFTFYVNTEDHASMTFDNLPKDVRIIEHYHPQEENREDEERVEMRHYATPQAHIDGGPSYGVYGYQVVSIEYEIRADEIQERPIGEASEGYLLALNNIRDLNIPYDHFHIGISEDHDVNITYLIHLMLIPHEQELQYGLECS
ncbi:hypothetical protein HQ403_03365 [Candidatus Kaiserbacteria bacterium]|nr:hypothetical protein [Candidatus Kaiserbacteria bacterium]